MQLLKSNSVNVVHDRAKSNKFESGVQKAMQLLQGKSSESSQEFSWKDRALKAAEGPIEVYGIVEPALAKEHYGEGPTTMMGDIATNYQNLEPLPDGAQSFTETAKSALNKIS